MLLAWTLNDCAVPPFTAIENVAIEPLRYFTERVVELDARSGICSVTVALAGAPEFAVVPAFVFVTDGTADGAAPCPEQAEMRVATSAAPVMRDRELSRGISHRTAPFALEIETLVVVTVTVSDDARPLESLMEKLHVPAFTEVIVNGFDPLTEAIPAQLGVPLAAVNVPL